MDNSYGFAELHEQLLLILDDIDRVCRKHGIEYTLFYGSLLGAVRHKGFIPWDDDADVVMTREEFEKFRAVYEKEMHPDFRIEHVCNLVSYSIVNSKYEIPGIEKRKNTIVNPWVTVFPFDHAPADPAASRRKAHRMRFLSGMLGKPPQFENFPAKSKILWNITTFCGKICGKRRAEKWYAEACRSDNGRDTGILANYSLNNDVIYHRFPSKCFREYCDMPFEDRVYRCVAEADELLTLEYGDYMTPLPPEKRDPRHLKTEK